MGVKEQGLSVCVFLCTSSSILSAADAQAVGGCEEGSCVFVCVCMCLRVCCDSLQRKLDMCWITRDIEDIWMAEFGGWSDDVISADTQ